MSVQNEPDFLVSKNEGHPLLGSIPIREMYKERNKGKSGNQRRKSVDLDSMIRLNKNNNRAMDMGVEPAFKTSLGTGFLNLFAKDF